MKYAKLFDTQNNKIKKIIFQYKNDVLLNSEAKWRVDFSDTWIFFMNLNKILPEKGFKIHLSAVASNACEIADVFFKYNLDKNYCFKITTDLNVLNNLNQGMHGFSQIGKFITIYPENDNEFIKIIKDLEVKYKFMTSVSIPSDYQYIKSNIVYYRYGEFIKSPDFEDNRQKIIPENIVVPLDDYYINRLDELPENYIIIDIIIKTGKTSVYKILDIKDHSIKILKEAKYRSCPDLYNFDSVNALMLEKKALKQLTEISCVPQLYDDFFVDNSYYIVMEMIEGKHIDDYVSDNKLDEKEILDLVISILDLAEKIFNKYQIIHRDYSFGNLLVSKLGIIHLIDFERALIRNNYETEYTSFGTPGFRDEENIVDNEKMMIYSIASILYYLNNLNEYKKVEKSFNSIINNTEIYEVSNSFIPKLFKKDISNKKELHEIYTKAFGYKYTTINEFKCDLQNICGDKYGSISK